MKKTIVDLKKFKLKERSPKKVKEEESLVKEEVVIETEIYTYNNIDDNTKLITNIIKKMIDNIIKLNHDDIEKINSSIKVNNIIQEFKYDKNTRMKLDKNEKPIFFPILKVESKIFYNYFNLNLVDIIKACLGSNTDYYKYVKNELHNIINYKKTSVNILSGNEFYRVLDLFLEIKNIYTNYFSLGNKKYFTKNDFDYEPLSVLKNNVNYKVLYVIPEKAYNDVNITKINDRGLSAPVIMDNNGKPIGRLWDAVYKVNKTFKMKLAIRCLLPFGVEIKDGKVINYNLDDCILNMKSLALVDGKLNSKVAILIFSNINTYFERRDLTNDH